MDTEQRFIELIEHHKRIIYKVCYVYAPGRGQIDDYFQEVVLSLGQFVDFIFRQFYHVELPEFDMVKFDETITQAESKMIHINW